MSASKKVPLTSRLAPEGVIPLVDFEGSAYECGKAYAKFTMKNYPGYREYLDMAYDWKSLDPELKSVVDERTPYLLDLHRGIWEEAGPPQKPLKSHSSNSRASKDDCTSFGIAGDQTVDGYPLSGQTKDTPLDRIELYIVLRMRIEEGPTLLILCYPGETLGYGMWSTGMSLYRNNLYSTAGREGGMSFKVWGMLTLAGSSIDESIELVNRFGLQGFGNCLIMDSEGKSASIEWNAGGIDVLPAEDGICTHANHPIGPETSQYLGVDGSELRCSEHRTFGLRKKLIAERGRLTPQLVLSILSDHTDYPNGGICRHREEEGFTDCITTAAVITEPTRGKLHVVRGNPCSNWPVTYTL